MTLALVLLLAAQHVVGAKAGFVNQVVGQSSLKVGDQIAESASIQTGADDKLEILLNPGSFLRLGSNSEARLLNVQLTSIVIELTRGEALIETANVDRKHPITVLSGGLHVRLTDNGLYRFMPDVVTVLAGKLALDGSPKAIKRNWQARIVGGALERTKLTAVARNSLDDWSRGRSADLAKANALAVRSYAGHGLSPNSWVYSGPMGAYTFFPRSMFRSPYGYTYYSWFQFFDNPWLDDRRAWPDRRTDPAQPSPGTQTQPPRVGPEDVQPGMRDLMRGREENLDDRLQQRLEKKPGEPGSR